MSKLKAELIKVVVVVAFMALLFAIFGGLSVLVADKGWDYVRIISGTLTACGVYIGVSGVRFGAAAQAGRGRYNLPAIVFGAALTCGAALYFFTRSAGWIPFCFILVLVTGAVRAGMKAKKPMGAGK